MKKLKTHLYYIFLCLPLLGFGIVFVIMPERYIPVCLSGITMWAECVLPSLFPFMVITLLLIKTGCANVAAKPLYKVTKKFNLPPPAAIIFLMSVFSGYPAGSRIIYEYYSCGQISTNDCKKLSVLCSSSGPLFMLGTIGYKFFNCVSCGLKLLCAHLIAIIFTSLIFCKTSKLQTEEQIITSNKNYGGNALYDSFYDAVIAVLVAGGFICFFYTFAAVASNLNLLLPIKLLLSPFLGEDVAEGVCYGLIEATGGCKYIAQSGHGLSLPLIGFLITFGGLSIILQQMCYLAKCGVKAKFFVPFKLIQGFLCFVILWLFSLI
jgi:sporulation integral membrane protein YlbJ